MNLDAARYIDRWVGVAAHLGLHGVGRATGRRLAPLRATTPPVEGRSWAPPRRLLGIKFYGLGNIVMLLPTLRELRATFPGIEIDFLTLPGNAPLLARTGLVDRILTVDLASFPRFVQSAMTLLGDLRRRGYDTVLDFEQFLKVSGIFAFFTGAPEVIGFDTEGQRRGWLYTTRVVSTDSQHTQDIFLRLAEPLGVQPGRAAPWTLPVTAEDQARARELLEPGPGPLVVMHIGTGESYHRVALKRWDVDRFAEVADALVERHGARVAFTGQGEGERALVAQATARMRHPAVDTCDRLDVGALAALLADAAFVVTGDTSVMHLAGALGTPVVALFGPTPPLLYGPRGAHDLVFYKDLYCSPCLSNYNFKMSTCTNPVCMRSIDAAEVIAAIEARYLSGGPAALPERRRAGS
jgi:heptosyltransferase I